MKSKVLSATVCNSINDAIRALNHALNSLLSLHQAGADVKDCVVAVTEALEKLEDLIPEETPGSSESANLASD